jgi:hypothetical protein
LLDDPAVHDTSAALANITAPADAQHVADWIDETGTGITWGRCVRGTRGATAGIEIVVAGWQSADGPRSGDDFPTVDDIDRIFCAHRRGLESYSRGPWTR